MKICDRNLRFHFKDIVQIGLIGIMCAGFFTSCKKSPPFVRDTETSKENEQDNYYIGRGPSSAPDVIEEGGQPRKKVVILNFWNDNSAKQDAVGEFAADELRHKLYLTHRVIFPNDLKTDLDTSDFVEGERIQVEQLIREGRRLGVAIIIIGRVSHVSFKQHSENIGLLRKKQSFATANVDIKVFDTQVGREVIATSKTGESMSSNVMIVDNGNLESSAFRAELTRSAIKQAMNRAMPDIMKGIRAIQWKGYIAKIEGKKLFINSGKDAGLNKGDILKVLNPGNDIYDPKTGAFLGHSEGEPIGTLEVVNFTESDGAAETRIYTGGNFKEGDTVELY